MTNGISMDAEWLEADGLGGFASGTVGGARTRRYHALLLAATEPPAGRMTLVNGFDAWVETAAGSFPISSQSYEPGVVSPDGASRIESFESEPWPKWKFRLEDGTRIEQEIFAVHGSPKIVVFWRLLTPGRAASLTVRPFLSVRDYHSTHHENPAFGFQAEMEGSSIVWRPYGPEPEIIAHFSGKYRHEPHWYRNFRYERERERGLDYLEDLASPGCFTWDLSQREAVLILAMKNGRHATGESVLRQASELRQAEEDRRWRFASPLHRAADAYIVERGRGKSVVAGYPWFTDWGRDTFIAIRGLCIAAGRLEIARKILLEWAGAVSEGMLPNRFPDQGREPEFNAVDASLWFIVAAHDYNAALEQRPGGVPAREREVLGAAVNSILEGYSRGTRFGIRMDDDGLLGAGAPGVQLTWMDAKVGDWVVTPRIGKPVEVQALWLNALRIGAAFDPKWMSLFERGLKSFEQRFWNESAGCLYDVVDADHARGKVDASFRPNQIFAVGGLPFPILEGKRARRIVDAVESRLLTPMGLRSLAPGEEGYRARYAGGPLERDGSYHQGTVWPWLIGPFAEAWVRVRGGTREAREEARARFLAPLVKHLSDAGIGHISEVADAEAPHAPGGCPFQAWSLGELLRLDCGILAEEKRTGARGGRVYAEAAL